MGGVAARIAVAAPRADFSQIAHADGFTALHAERRLARRSAIHQDESHDGAWSRDLKLMDPSVVAFPASLEAIKALL